jgi:hypothetical protein
MLLVLSFAESSSDSESIFAQEQGDPQGRKGLGAFFSESKRTEELQATEGSASEAVDVGT